MASAFLDSSAYVKYWVDEPGTAWVRGLLADPAEGDLYVSALAGSEVAHAIAKASREGRIEKDGARRALDGTRRAFRDRLHVVAVTAEVMWRAMDLAELRGLRGADAAQLAVACTIDEIERAFSGERLRFVASDRELLDAAAAEGLQAIAPQQPGSAPK